MRFPRFPAAHGLTCLLVFLAVVAVGCSGGLTQSTNQPEMTAAAAAADDNTPTTTEPAASSAAAPTLTTEAVSPAPTTMAVDLVDVVDGDTIHVRHQRRIESVRLIGIDAPELGEPYAAEAASALATLLRGQPLTLELDIEPRDRYGRLLAYLTAGSTFVNAELLRLGLVTVYTVPPNIAYETELREAQTEAEAAGAGMWAAPSSGAPLEVAAIHYNAAGDDNHNLNDEYVIFRVLESGSLGGFTVEDEAGHTYRFPDRLFCASQTLTLHTGSGTDTRTDLYWGQSESAVWNNDGDTVKVLDHQGQVVLSQNY